MAETDSGRPLRFYSKDSGSFDISTDTLVAEKLHVFTGWMCGIGSQNLYIDMDGGVWGGSCRVGGTYGNVYDDFQLPQSWVICPKATCSCGADQFVPKAKNEESIHLLKNLNKKSDCKITKCTESRIDKDWVAIEPKDPRMIKQVYWELGRRCNFDCSYCFPGIHNKTDPHKSLHDLFKATLQVEELFCKGDAVHFVISGGEPTLNPAFMDWVKFLKSMGHIVSMHTNGSRNSDYYAELVHYTNINVSVHFEFAILDRLAKNIAAVTAKKVAKENINMGHLEVKLMMAPGDRDKALAFEKKLLKIPNFTEYCTWSFVPLRGGDFGHYVVDGYTEEDYQLFGDRKSVDACSNP